MTSEFPVLEVFILTALLVARSSEGMQCMECRDPVNDPGCTKAVPVNCNSPHQICYKAVGKITSKDDVILKGCKEYFGQDEPLNAVDCDESHPGAATPYPDQGFRCWCDDRDLCNSSQPSFRPPPFILVTSASVLLNYFHSRMSTDFQ